MTYYTMQGQVPKKRHTQMRQSNGQLYTEELFGREGFSGRQSLLYHITPPTNVTQVRDLGSVAREFSFLGPLVHRHLRTLTLPPPALQNAVDGRVILLGNEDVALGVAVVTEAMDYFYRTAEGDELFFVHQGHGMIETIFGRLDYRSGDYVVLPVGTTYRVIPTAGEVTRLLVIEAQGQIAIPKRYMNEAGQMMEHAPFCERDFRLPQLETHDEQGNFEVRVRARKQLTSFVLPFHPFDVVGWDGALYPYIFNIADFEPITGRIHQPPPVHQTFSGENFVICSFVPRKMDYHPEAIPVPYHHSNIESDEVLYYVDGHFMSRKGIEIGSLTLHPAGIAHGPHPGVVENSLGVADTAEWAVMLDAFHPLGLTAAALAIEDPQYMYSWRL
ncbi:homogentisate 1,2-dioxygenase [Sulfoacidibacillus thermotolerans]|uniref:Homogentisate 1,2-dioxygenase n=1 Tax=Sulfoacidibacillus thermotolerans TaxID=1765684 RepID=A0A2U3DCF7_SULT2|nr:homogentisate 1,2-dioxygenase [Sulfoacidibacillus thermotolerans]PWI58969.1 homogentisate 1,2-dioxygenase [Sulfoacidibacillus thermotolerans]